MKTYTVLCIGNREGGDDAIGSYIADHLLKENLHNIQVIDAGVAPENFTGLIRSSPPDELFIVDAIDMNRNPGEIRRVPASMIGVMHVSTHGIPLSVFVSYFHQFVSDITIIGIQPKTMQGNMTEKVHRAADKLIELIKTRAITTIPLLPKK